MMRRALCINHVTSELENCNDIRRAAFGQASTSFVTHPDS